MLQGIEHFLFFFCLCMYVCVCVCVCVSESRGNIFLGVLVNMANSHDQPRFHKHFTFSYFIYE